MVGLCCRPYCKVVAEYPTLKCKPATFWFPLPSCKVLLLQRHQFGEKLGDLRWRHSGLQAFHAWRACSQSQRAQTKLIQSDPPDPSPDPNVLCCRWALRFWHITVVSSASAKSLQQRAMRLRLEQQAAAHLFTAARQEEVEARCQLDALKAWRAAALSAV